MLPAHWETHRLGRLFRESSQRASTSTELGYPILSVSIHDGISDREMDEDELDRKVTRSDDRSLYKVVEENDLAYNMMRAWQGAFGAAQVNGLISPAYVVCKPRTSLPSRFFELLLRTPTAVTELKRFSRGITDFRLRLYWDDFKKIEVPVPPEYEQKQILAFLDYETAKIDALIEKQQQLIALLGEKRQAVISHAVTKGLNPDAPMRDSGIEWLGQVPEHWTILALKFLISMTSGDGITSDSIESQGEYPVYGGNGLRGYTDSYTHDGNFVLIGRQGALCGNVNYAAGKFWASEHAVVATPTRKLETKWLGEMIRAMNLNQYSETAAQPGLSITHVGNVGTVAPPIEEQKAVAKYLTEKTGQFDGLCEKADNAVELLLERRTALISAAVTGKIDVRDWQPPSSEVEHEAEMEMA